MAPAKKAAKKATKNSTPKARAARKPKEYWAYVLSERTKWLTWRPVEVYSSYASADDRRKLLESTSVLGIATYKVDKVAAGA